MHNKYIGHIVLQLEDIKKPGKIETKDTKITNFSILSTKRKIKVGSKGKMSYQMVDEFRIAGLQNYNVFEKSNPIKINILNSEMQGKLSRSGTRRYKYRFIIDSLLISSYLVQDTNGIFLICNGLNYAADSLINGKRLGIIDISEIRDWTKIKGEPKWINIIFDDSENPTLAKHFSFAFKIVILSNLLNFQLSFLDDEAKPVKFPPNEKKY